MIYADYEYYTGEYLLGRGAELPWGEFLFWEKQARREIDIRTFDRIKTLDEVPEAVKDCVCAVAEILYSADKISRAASESGAAGPLVSYSNDGESGTFATDTGSIYTESGKRAEISRLIRKYLGHTGLLYAGVTRCES